MRCWCKRESDLSEHNYYSVVSAYIPTHMDVRR